MTWAEFELRLFSYNRQKEREDRNFREVAFRSMWAFHTDPKNLPKTPQKYWKIGKDSNTKSNATEAQRIAMIKATELYKKEVNERKIKS